MSSARNLYHRVEELPNAKNVMRTVINYYQNGGGAPTPRRPCPRCASTPNTRALELSVESLADDSAVVPLLRGDHTGPELEHANVKRSRSSVTPEQIARFRRMSQGRASIAGLGSGSTSDAANANNQQLDLETPSSSGSQASTPGGSESTHDPSSAGDTNTSTPLRQQQQQQQQVSPPVERRRRLSAIISPLGFLDTGVGNDECLPSATSDGDRSSSPPPPFPSPHSPSTSAGPAPVRPRILLDDRSISSALNDAHAGTDFGMLELPSAPSTHSPTPLEESRSEMGSSLDISSISTPSPSPSVSRPLSQLDGYSVTFDGTCDCSRASTLSGLQLNGSANSSSDADSGGGGLDAEKLALSIEEKVFNLHDSHDSFFSSGNCIAVCTLSVYVHYNMDL